MAEISQKIINFVRNKKYRSRAIVFLLHKRFSQQNRIEIINNAER